MCTSDNEWCDGADLARTGRVIATDRAFFEAAEGWDPVTGLGTPIYEKMLEAALAAGSAV